MENKYIQNWVKILESEFYDVNEDISQDDDNIIYNKNGKYILINYNDTVYSKDDVLNVNKIAHYRGKKKLSIDDLNNKKCKYITNIEKVINLKTGTVNFTYTNDYSSSPLNIDKEKVFIFNDEKYAKYVCDSINEKTFNKYKVFNID